MLSTFFVQCWKYSMLIMSVQGRVNLEIHMVKLKDYHYRILNNFPTINKRTSTRGAARILSQVGPKNMKLGQWFNHNLWCTKRTYFSPPLSPQALFTSSNKCIINELKWNSYKAIWNKISIWFISKCCFYNFSICMLFWWSCTGTSFSLTYPDRSKYLYSICLKITRNYSVDWFQIYLTLIELIRILFRIVSFVYNFPFFIYY